MKCLIIAAGKGSRLKNLCTSKPLLELNNIPLIEHVIIAIKESGINEFYIVIGFNGELIKQRLVKLVDKYSISIEYIYNHQWEKGNGISVYSANKIIDEQFILLMSDHLFDPDITKTLIHEYIENDEIILAVDKRISDNPLIDIDDVTKVLEKNGKIIDIGKSVKDYNCFDTGIFYCSPVIFDALKESISNGDESLSGGIRVLASKMKARIFDTGEKFWLDVDDENAYAKALNLFKK